MLLHVKEVDKGFFQKLPFLLLLYLLTLFEDQVILKQQHYMSFSQQMQSCIGIHSFVIN